MPDYDVLVDLPRYIGVSAAGDNTGMALIGEQVKVTAEIRDATGALTSPAVVKIEALCNGVNVLAFASMTNDSLGKYHYTLSLGTNVGQWTVFIKLQDATPTPTLTQIERTTFLVTDAGV